MSRIYDNAILAQDHIGKSEREGCSALVTFGYQP